MEQSNNDKNGQVYLNSYARSADEIREMFRTSRTFIIAVGFLTLSVENASAFSEVEYRLERTGTRTKKGRLILPEDGKTSTVILNTHTLIRFRAVQAAEGALQVEAEIWDRRDGRSRELYANPSVTVQPGGKPQEVSGGRPGRGDFKLEIRSRETAAGARKPAGDPVQYELINTSLFAPRRSWDE